MHSSAILSVLTTHLNLHILPIDLVAFFNKGLFCWDYFFYLLLYLFAYTGPNVAQLCLFFIGAPMVIFSSFSSSFVVCSLLIETNFLIFFTCFKSQLIAKSFSFFPSFSLSLSFFGQVTSGSFESKFKCQP